mgnify:FL=1
MTIDRMVRLMAGMMILVSIALTQYVDPNWMWLTVFVGFNLMQSGLTNICPLAKILKKMGVSEGTACC